jgi:hypothetical protein
MSWERRPGGTYYYRSIRIAGRVTKQYFGRGAIADVAESLDKKVSERRADERNALHAELCSLEPLDMVMKELDLTCRRMLEATLLAGGYHQANRVWRPRRARPDHGTN